MVYFMYFEEGNDQKSNQNITKYYYFPLLAPPVTGDSANQ